MADKTVLLAEDDASIRLIVNQTLVAAGYEVRATSRKLDKYIGGARNQTTDTLFVCLKCKTS